MISMLFYSDKKKELKAVVNAGNEVVCALSDEDWEFFTYSEREKIYELLAAHPAIDISCVDVAASDGIGIAEKLRTDNKNMYVILVTNPDISPVLYIRPTIMAGSLLIRPLNAETVKKVFFEAVREYLKTFYEDGGEDSFAINTRDGRQLIPFNLILFFESRNKKIYVSTQTKEYSFYDTLDNLQDRLPDSFLRCHRSFIVSGAHIKNIRLSQNYIELENGVSVPLSRSYKSVVKEFGK